MARGSERDDRPRRRRPLARPGPYLIAAAVAAVVVAVLIVPGALRGGGGVCGGDRGDFGGDERSEYPFPVETFEDLGREHLAAGEQYDFYNSNPPTTGPHAPAPAKWGVCETPVAKEIPVHNMEHGGVVIWYGCSAGATPLDEAQCQELRDQLAAVTDSAMADGRLVLMVPFSGMESRIALTAWQTLDAFDEFDGERVRAFIDAFDRLFNPEGF